MILVTGGAGFIGSNFILDWIAATGESVVNLDKLTYAGNLENPGRMDLIMIEVQSGECLGEDDIVRFDDVYGRM